MAVATTCPTCGLEVSPDIEYCPRDGTELSDAMGREPTVRRDSLTGAKLGDYVVKQRIGAGGMGIVYEGLQPMIGKRVAIKVLRGEFAEDPVQVQRLLAEARAVNAIRHRGIIDIFGFGELPDGRQYIVMEYLAGRPLDAVILERGALPAIEALPILDEVTAALSAAHGAGVIHRDLKPSNIFVVSQPDGTRYIKLLDFGLAKSTTGGTGHTRVTQVVGTPEYMAPEQAQGTQLGPWTDLYALGVVAFEVLTGQIPFDGNSAVEVAMKHIEQPPPAPSSLDGSVPPEMDRLILRLMSKRAEDRPMSAEIVRTEIKRIQRMVLEASTRISEPVYAKPTTLARSPTTATPTPVNGRATPHPLGGGTSDATTIGPPPKLSFEVTNTTPVARPAAAPRRASPALRISVARKRRPSPFVWGLGAVALAVVCVIAWRLARPAPLAPLPPLTPIVLDADPPKPVPVPTAPIDPTPTRLAPIDPNAPVRLTPVDEPRSLPPPKQNNEGLSASAIAGKRAAPAPTRNALLNRIEGFERSLRQQGVEDGDVPMLALQDLRKRIRTAHEGQETRDFDAELARFGAKHIR
jgi:serine/threonine protein kinase